MTGSGWRFRIQRLALLVAGVVTAACTSASEPGITWQARLAEGDVLRAEEAAATGQRDQALELARRALDGAREAAALRTVGRALLLVGSLEGDLASCQEAAAHFERCGDPIGQSQALVAGARILLGRQMPGPSLAALEQAEAVIDSVELERPDWSTATAEVHHLTSRALAELGRPEESYARARQADLALSLLDDAAETRLRFDVDMALAEIEAVRDEPSRAITRYSRALWSARRMKDLERQIEALAGVVSGLTQLRRYDDAVTHCERALALARELGEPGRIRQLGRQGLDLLGRLGDVSDSARRAEFEGAVLTGT